MTPAETIAAKRDGRTLTETQIGEFVDGFVQEQIPDYQMAAMAMAICLRGMTAAETAVLTDRMLASGTRLQWADGDLPRVDKHSTGGIGDKVSLVLAPLLASCDLLVPMISGRGLGPSGGTLDKLESIAGFDAQLSTGRLMKVTREAGCVITGTTDEIAPADRKLYALRDVTATVESIPLITASIMSKKLAENLDALVLDVKFGSGAFMKTVEDARQLALSLVRTGARLGLRTSALLTDMNQPLGRLAGNAVEVNESLAVLDGGGPADLVQVTIQLGAELLLLTGRVSTSEEGAKRLVDNIDSGAAMERFEKMVRLQGGNLDAPRTVAAAHTVNAAHTGYVARIDTRQLGLAIIELGGGRKDKTDSIDHSVGLEMLVRIGESVEQGQPLVTVFANQQGRDTAQQMVQSAIEIADAPPDPHPLILETIDGPLSPTGGEG